MKSAKLGSSKKTKTPKYPCPRCGKSGVVDFVDLVRGTADLHCRHCPTGWRERTEASMSYLRS